MTWAPFRSASRNIKTQQQRPQLSPCIKPREAYTDTLAPLRTSLPASSSLLLRQIHHPSTPQPQFVPIPLPRLTCPLRNTVSHIPSRPRTFLRPRPIRKRTWLPEEIIPRSRRPFSRFQPLLQPRTHPHPLLSLLPRSLHPNTELPTELRGHVLGVEHAGEEMPDVVAEGCCCDAVFGGGGGGGGKGERYD